LLGQTLPMRWRSPSPMRIMSGFDGFASRKNTLLFTRCSLSLADLKSNS